MTQGVDGFVEDLRSEQIDVEVRNQVVVYSVTPVAGPRAGREVMTAVSVDELQGWPMTPPHWIHLPDEVQFASTNTDKNGVLAGWTRHSRDIGQWDLSRKSILTWIAHVRGVLGQVSGA